MEKFIIKGGIRLAGEITVSGAKNSATAIIAATLLVREKCVIENVPRIEDVLAMLTIIKGMGGTVNWIAANSVEIETRDIDPSKINTEIICKLRSSIFLMGSLIARFPKIKIPPPGGCQIGSRPFTAHFNALSAMGVDIKRDDGCYVLSRNKLKANKIVLEEISPTATANAIIASVLTHGKTIITCADCGYSVMDLIWFLQKAGAKISGLTSHTLTIEGVRSLRQVNYQVMPDPIELGTFMALAAATRSKINIINTAPDFIEYTLRKFKEANVNYKIDYTGPNKQNNYRLANILVNPASKLKAVARVHNMPYPGFIADALPPFAVLMTQAEGVSLIHDWMYEGRQRYVSELIKMGANATICDPHRVIIAGPTPLYGNEITSFDLRAGATLIIAALLAEGESIIHNIYQVDRGYEKIEQRLQNLGAKIKRVKSKNNDD